MASQEMKLIPIAGEYARLLNWLGVMTVNWATLLVLLPWSLATTAV